MPSQLALQIFYLFLSALQSNPGFELFGFPVLGGVEGGVSGLLASMKQLDWPDLGWLSITENYNDKTNKLRSKSGILPHHQGFIIAAY